MTLWSLVTVILFVLLAWLGAVTFEFAVIGLLGVIAINQVSE